MADGNRIEAWNHTSQILSMLHNVNCTKKENLTQPWQFHPRGTKPAQAAPVRRVSVDALDEVFDPQPHQ